MASSSLAGSKTSCISPLPKVGRLTRSPGVVKSTCSIRSRMCGRSLGRGRRCGRARRCGREADVMSPRSDRLHPHLRRRDRGRALRDLLGAQADAGAGLQEHRLAR